MYNLSLETGELLKELEISFLKVFMKNLKDKSGERSADKVNNIHGVIAKHLQKLMGNDYVLKTKLTTGKEEQIKGRYINKRVDIVIERKNGKQVAGIGLKSILSSYIKNRNNYFENMLGETANIRCNNIPYFQIVILPYKSPNFKKDGEITSYSRISDLNNYIQLSKDNTVSFFHTPIKTLLMIIDYLPDYEALSSKNEYGNFYINKEMTKEFSIKLHNIKDDFDSAVINKCQK
ncbi:hypothetical protein S100390_v1c08740 [Spiroplasma sp. NBRC 100390]|uniref:hypothetical protein n=1 Tax=unclassified Spiroplasma TaxID=2637901 RepID=UPI0008928E9C|nr:MULTISPECIES: hypothetical protein [unclassified Spiroplasma]AOX44210.1 hypothetical protein STU14_v1c08740 [Spiroplasma sp. TU-14]APE13680.1 hypothetical protein S100390_v1c08740 [Spiroplasma sp. NBRC 100390]